jgi:hypothetical protein
MISMTRDSRSLLLVMIALALVVTWPTMAAQEKAEEKPLSIGITGSTPSDRTKNPTAILGSAKIQRMILEISGP